MVGEVIKAFCSLILRLSTQSMLLKTQFVLLEVLFKPSFLSLKFEEPQLPSTPL